MDSKQLATIHDLLRTGLGMSAKSAAATAWKWQKSDSQTADASLFVHKAIEHQIDEYRTQNFEKFGLVIAVYPATNAKSIQLQLPSVGKLVIGYDCYIFKPCHNEQPPKSLRVRLFHGNIQLSFCGSWHPVSTYLDEIDTSTTLEHQPQLDYDRQYYWWRKNGKSFNIMKLPGELRNAIFDMAFPGQAHPFPSSKCRNRRYLPSFEHSHTALMRTNRQLHAEASERFYQTTSFLLEHRQLVNKVLNNTHLTSRLRHLRLDLTHSGYLDLFRFRPQDFESHTYVKRQFRELTDLKSLEIHIQAPSRIAEKSWLQGACQVTAVDMIIRAAMPSIQGLPVTFTGYLKDSQKAAYEDQTAAAREFYLSFKALTIATGTDSSLSAFDDFSERMASEERGGVRVDGQEWAPAPPPDLEWAGMTLSGLRDAVWCSCKTRCRRETWDPTD